MMTGIDHERVAPTYLLTTVPDFVDSVTYRMLADGLILQDIRAAREEVAEWGDWPDFWLDRAAQHERSAERSLADGHRLTAGQHYVRASLSAHYGQFMLFAPYEQLKQQVWERKEELYAKATPLLSPPAERFEVPAPMGEIPGWLRVPAVSAPVGCVIHIGGLDAHKEDAHQFTELCLARGVATFAFDGPGQGEAYYRGMLMNGDYHQAISAVIDVLQAREEIDQERIAVVGRSTGGFLAPDATIRDPRIKACAVWGAMYDLAVFEDSPPLIKDGFQMVTGAADWDQARERMGFVDLAGRAQQISCPLYVLHGGRDNITPSYNAERMVAEASGTTELHLYETSVHCNHDVAHIARPAMADWLAAQLKEGS